MLNEYLLFLAKTLTWVGAVLVVTFGVLALLRRGREPSGKGRLEVTDLAAELRAMGELLDAAMVPPRQRRALRRAARRARDRRPDLHRKRIFVLNFFGDLQATGVAALRHEVTALLARARQDDEVVVRLESAGGLVHAYGLAASQLDRIAAAGIRLTVCVDKVAASGGYLMACVADQILAAPFAVLGSIGVAAQIPNIHRLLKRHDVDIELLTAGEYKRTLTVLGENTDAGREKFQRDLDTVHDLFKQHVALRRPGLDIAAVATGEVWLGTRALAMGLVDRIQTSDEYLAGLVAGDAAVYELRYRRRMSWRQRLGLAGDSEVRWWPRGREPQLPM